MQRQIRLTGFLALLVIGCVTAAGIKTQSAAGSDEPSPTPAEPEQVNLDFSSDSDTESRPSKSAATADESSPRRSGRRAPSLQQRMKSIRRSISERNDNSLRDRSPTPATRVETDASKLKPIAQVPADGTLNEVPDADPGQANLSSRRTVRNQASESGERLTEDVTDSVETEPQPLKLASPSDVDSENANTLNVADQGSNLNIQGDEDTTGDPISSRFHEPESIGDYDSVQKSTIRTDAADDTVVSVEDADSDTDSVERDAAERGTDASLLALPSNPANDQGQLEQRDDTIFMSTSPVLRVATMGPRTVVVGKESIYLVRVQNSSDTLANGVIIDVKIPSRAEVIQADASNGRARYETVGEQEGRVRWNIDQVDPHAVEEIAIRLIPRDNRSFELSVNWSFNPDASVAQIEVQEPKLEVLLTGPSDILYGENKVYTITVRNPGTGDAENVVLNLLPINRSDAAGVRRLGTLAAGKSERIDVELTAQQPGQIWIRAQAFGDNGLRAEVAEEVLVRRANLEVLLSAPEIKYAGTVAAYTVRVVNSGDAAAENVVATAVLPQGAEYVNGGASSAQFDETSGRVSWSLGSLTPGAQRAVELKCVLGTPGANRLEVVAEAADELASFQSAVTVVEALADLKLLVDQQGPVAIDDVAVYEVHLVNRGSKPAEAIRVYAFFSEGVEPTEVIGGQARLEPGQVVFEEIERIGPGQEFLFKISARASEVGDHIFRAEVTCEDPDTELAAQETTRFYGKIGREEDLADESQGANEAATVRR